MATYKTRDAQHKFYKSSTWQKLRKEILNRDNNECQMCKEQGIVRIDTEERNSDGRKKAQLIVHHKQELEYHPELALEPDNLVVVCWGHHEEIHNRIKYFKTNRWKQDERW